MTYIVSLELPDTIMKRVMEQADTTGRTAEEVLTDWIKQQAIVSSGLLQPDVEYPVYTPLGGEETAQELWEYLQEVKAAKRTCGE